MKRIELYENAYREKRHSELGVVPMVYFSYFKSIESGDELLDFYDCIYDEYIEASVNQMRAVGIKQFTVSSGFSSVIKSIAKFCEYGCSVVGMTKTHSEHRNWTTGEYDEIPAILMQID